MTADQGQLRIVGWSPDAQAIHFIDETGLRAVTVADGRVRSTMSFKGKHGTFVATSGSAVSREVASSISCGGKTRATSG